MTFVLLTGAESRLFESNAEKARSGTTDHDTPSRQCTRSCAATTQEIISKRSFEVLEHPSYSPDVAPCDFFLFPALKQVLRGQQFDDINELPTAVQSAISSLPKESYNNAFTAWVKRCKTCTSFGGEIL